MAIYQNHQVHQGVSMLPALLLTLREGIEGVLVLTIVLSLLTKAGKPELKRYAWYGAVAALVLSFAAAGLLTWLGTEFEGRGEVIFEGTTMLIAGIFLLWMVFWMKRQTASTRQTLEGKILQGSGQNGSRSIFGVTFFAVLREGLELALFLVAIGFGAQKGMIFAGALAGITAVALIGILLYNSMRKIRMAVFFTATNLMLTFFAAGLLAGAAREFSELGILPVLVPKMYDITSLLGTDNFVGGTLKALFGYNPAPSLTEILVYLGVIAVVILSTFKPLRTVRSRA